MDEQVRFTLMSGAINLPGHQAGRQRLVSALGGDESTPVKVEGHWEFSTLVVERIVDVMDAEGRYWLVADCGDDLELLNDRLASC